MNIYRVDYSDKTGFYIEVAYGMESCHGGWTDGNQNCESCDGWRETEAEAVDFWRKEAIAAAAAYRLVASKIESMSHGPAPVIPTIRIMKPELE